MSNENHGIDEFVEFLRERGRKSTTLKNYEWTLNAVLGILKDSELPTTAEAATVECYMTIRDYPGIAESSRKTYCGVYATWVHWATGRRIAAEAGALWGTPAATTVRWITPEDFTQMWRIAQTMDRVILALGGWMGLRRHEMSCLEWRHIRGEYIEIHGKGHGPDGKIETRKMPARVSKILDEWKIESKRTNPCDHVLTVEWEGRFFEISDTTVGEHVRKLGEKAGIQVTTHSLRRLYACTLEETGATPIQIAQLMRHECIETTYRHYLKPNPTKLDDLGTKLTNRFQIRMY